MESATQKLALSKSVQAEDKKVKAKITTPRAKKTLTDKSPQAKPRTNVAMRKKPQAAKKNEKQAVREKIVRDSFTMPVEDYKLLSELKKKCLASGVVAKKSELLRAGLKALVKLNITTLKKQLSELTEIKTGRPPKISK